ncbi:MAG: hypothetical protein HY542_01080 [Deltaproteobacteria bacterium]|nr:hypothetical protein [Deltaproteobacteria bacterium]
MATLEVRPGKPSILLANFTGGATTSRVVMQEVPEQIRKLQGEERQLTSDAAKNPGDGETKIRLARARIALGNYNVEPLLAEGMEQGGDRSEGTQLMVLTRTLLGKIGSARAWAEKGIALNVKGSDFPLYKQALDFLAGTEKSDPSPKIPLNDKPDLTNATHHYLVGLSHEKKKEFSEAVKRFASAYGYGLIGSEVQDKIMATLDKTDQKFKKSAEGLEIYDKFADVYLEIH